MTDKDNVSGIRAGGGDAAAAQETWSAGEAMVLEAGRAREEGRFDDALRQLLAAFARMLSNDRERDIGDFMVMLEWRFLAEEYGPARAAMIDARDAQVHRLLAGESTYGLARNEWLGPPSRFSLIAGMNETLRDPHSTCEVFAWLDARLRGLGRGPEADALVDAALAGLANDALRDWVRRDIRWPGVIHRAMADHHMERDGAAHPYAAARIPVQHPIETERLILRPFTLEDAAAWLPLVSLPEIIRYTGDTPAQTVEEARELLCSRPLRDYTLCGFGRLAVIEKASGRLVGFCGFKNVLELGEIDIGYRFLPDCWGMGYATESAAALMAQGRRAHGIRRVVGTVHPDNPASGRVLEKLGLCFERLLEPDEQGVRFLLYATSPPE